MLKKFSCIHPNLWCTKNRTLTVMFVDLFQQEVHKGIKNHHLVSYRDDCM